MKKLLLLIALFSASTNIFASKNNQNKNNQNKNNQNKNNQNKNIVQTNNNPPNTIKPNTTPQPNNNSSNPDPNKVFVFGSPSSLVTESNQKISNNNLTINNNNNSSISDNNTAMIPIQVLWKRQLKLKDFIQELQLRGMKISKKYRITDERYKRTECPWGVSIKNENLRKINDDKDFLKDVCFFLEILENLSYGEGKVNPSCSMNDGQIIKKRGDVRITYNKSGYRDYCHWIVDEKHSITVHYEHASNPVECHGYYHYDNKKIDNSLVENEHFYGEYKLNNPFLCYTVLKNFIEGKSSSNIKANLK